MELGCVCVCVCVCVPVRIVEGTLLGFCHVGVPAFRDRHSGPCPLVLELGHGFGAVQIQEDLSHQQVVSMYNVSLV